jgi:hypothetical protein
VQHATCHMLLHVSFCRTLMHTTCSIMLYALTLLTPKHKIFLIQLEARYRYVIDNNCCCFCVFGVCGRRRVKYKKKATKIVEKENVLFWE